MAVLWLAWRMKQYKTFNVSGQCKNFSLIPLVLLAWQFTSAFCFTASASELAGNNTPELKQQQLNQLRQEIQTLKTSLEQQQGEKSRLQQTLKQAELTIAQTARQLYTTTQQIEKLNNKLINLDTSLQVLDTQLQQHQQLLSGQLRASYAVGRQEYLKLLLNQQDPAIVSRIITYFNYFNQARSEEIARVNTLVQQIAQQKQEILATQQDLEQQQQQLNAVKLSLESEQQQRNELLLQVDKEILSADEKLKAMQANEKNLLQLIEKLNKALADIANLPTEKPFHKQKGKLYWPAAGRVRKLYGRWRSIDKVKWQGVIIQAGAGTPVFSVSHGRVAYADWLRGYGLLTIIDHGNGYMSLYGHNQTLLKEEGDWVNEADVIATVGSSGGLSKPGLYFEVRHNGQATNPSRWCKKQRR